MCIIVDTNNISRVFNPKNAEHNQFAPVFNWIVNGKGKLIIGGSTFNKEIQKNKWFLPFLGQLSRINKVVKINDQAVDDLEIKIKALIPKDLDFDDPHIVSLLKISKCKLICSSDKRAYSFFTSKGMFKASNKPKIYSNLKNVRLLTENNIANCCKPSPKINKNQVLFLQNIIDNYK